MEFIQLMSIVTIIVTILMFMTGIPPCLNMYRTRSTKNVPYPLFVLGSLGCITNLHYGLRLENGTLIFLNGIGSCLLITYVLTYLLLVRSKGTSIVLLLLAVAYQCGLYTYLNGLPPAEFTASLGSMGAFATTVYVCLPSIELFNNVRQKHADGVPLVMVAGGLVCGSCWLVYGMMLGDPNVYMPNVPGIAINLCKFIVHLAYGEGSKSSHAKAA